MTKLAKVLIEAWAKIGVDITKYPEESDDNVKPS
jgi:hypothetical protein